MRLGIIAVGNAGGKVTDKFLEYEEQTGRHMTTDVVAINTARADLNKLENIPEDKQLLIGQSKVGGQGVGAVNEKAAEIAKQDIDEIQNAINMMPAHSIDAFLIPAGLGGGTGSGSAPVVAKSIGDVYEKPIYSLALLPGKDEGGIYQLNAATSFQSLAKYTDAILSFDNDAWRQTGQTIEGGYNEINTEIAKRFVTLLAAGEEEQKNVAENVIDSQEIIETLGEQGVSVVGYAETPVENSTEDNNGFLSKLTSKPENGTKSPDSTELITTLVKKATNGQLTTPADISSVDRALVLLSGPPEHLSRKGMERSRVWLQDVCDTHEVRGGDDPRPDSNVLQCVVLLSNVTNIDRIEELKKEAVTTQSDMKEKKAKSKEEFEDLVKDDNDELDPVI